MKAMMIIEFRLYLAEKLMSWAYDVAPEKEGKRLKLHIIKYFAKL